MEAQSSRAAFVTESDESVVRATGRHELVVTPLVGREVQGRDGQDAHTAMAWEDSPRPVVHHRDDCGVAPDVANQLDELGGRGVLELLRVEEDLDAGVHRTRPSAVESLSQIARAPPVRIHRRWTLRRARELRAALWWRLTRRPPMPVRSR